MKKALVIINIGKEESVALAAEIKEFLLKRNIETDFYSFDGFADNIAFKDYSLAITLGGDGTVLYAARNCVDYNIPVFPVNFGQFGFIATVQPGDWKEELEAFFDGKYFFTERSMLSVKLIRNNECIYTSYALNDVVLCAQRAASTISLEVNYNNRPLCKLKSDGVIVSTPTGSTAYSAAAGGPIVDPDLEAFIFTPVNSFSLSSRPIVLSPKGELLISVSKSRAKEISISIDGQEPVNIITGDVISICNLGKKVKLLCSTQEKFYSALRSKLNWSGVPHA